MPVHSLNWIKKEWDKRNCGGDSTDVTVKTCGMQYSCGHGGTAVLNHEGIAKECNCESGIRIKNSCTCKKQVLDVAPYVFPLSLKYGM